MQDDVNDFQELMKAFFAMAADVDNVHGGGALHGNDAEIFAIDKDDHGGARDEVNAPNVAKFFAKHSRACLRGDDELVWEDCGPLTAF